MASKGHKLSEEDVRALSAEGLEDVWVTEIEDGEVPEDAAVLRLGELAALLESCDEGTRLCVAADLTLPNEAIATRTIAQWRRARTVVGRRPAVFLLQA